MNALKQLLPGVLLILSIGALADTNVVTQAYEVALSNFRMPGSPNGTLAFRACEDCPQKVISVTAGTSYVVNGRNLEMGEFRKSLSRVRKRKDATVIVMHHLESDTVTSVRIDL